MNRHSHQAAALQQWVLTVVPLLGPRATVDQLAAHANVGYKRAWRAAWALYRSGRLTRHPLPSRGRPAYRFAVVEP